MSFPFSDPFFAFGECSKAFKALLTIRNIRPNGSSTPTAKLHVTTIFSESAVVSFRENSADIQVDLISDGCGETF